MKKRTEQLLDLIALYSEQKVTYDDIVKHIKENYKQYQGWGRTLVSKRTFELEYRNFILDYLNNLDYGIVKHDINISSIIIKPNIEKQGILIRYSINKTFIVDDESIEIFNVEINFNECSE